MAFLKCVLHFSALIKTSDRNLVGNKGKFSVKFEIADVRFVVHPSSQYIYCACLGILKQRRNYKEKFDDLNDNLLHQYHEKAGAKGLPVKTEMTGSTPTLVHFQSTLTLTSHRQRPQHGTDKISPPQTTIVSFTDEWKSKTVTRTLPDDLGSTGKMLCGGTYTQIVLGTWRCKKVRE